MNLENGTGLPRIVKVPCDAWLFQDASRENNVTCNKNLMIYFSNNHRKKNNKVKVKYFNACFSHKLTFKKIYIFQYLLTRIIFGYAEFHEEFLDVCIMRWYCLLFFNTHNSHEFTLFSLVKYFNSPCFSLSKVNLPLDSRKKGW